MVLLIKLIGKPGTLSSRQLPAPYDDLSFGHSQVLSATVEE